MKKLAVYSLLVQFTCVFCSFEKSFSAFKVPVNSNEQKKAAENVLKRLLGPEKAGLFDLNIGKENVFKKDGFYISKGENDEKVRVTGPNAVSLCWGVHYYLKNFCNCHISWDGDQLNIPEELPLVEVFIESRDSLRYYQNACTSSYSFVWWDWNRWEREIDWMALNGINLALAFTGTEAIWQRVYDGLGLNSNDFTGPAFLAWNRMGNLRNFSHGLTNNWHEAQLNLQHKILNRMRELGITPILPAFCGIVPRSFPETFPQANLTKMSKWGKFSDEYCCPYLLSPHDPLFYLVAHLFMREYINEFLTNHIYSCDTFNENVPESGDSDYLSALSKKIYTQMTEFDPDAVWVIQGWMFIEPFWLSKNRVKAFLSGVPVGNLLVLDLQSDLTPQYERLDSYFGHPFIWCTLLNFGGQLGMYGHLSRVNKEVLKGRYFSNSTMVGIGITPEGIDQNYLMYEFTLESSLRSEVVNLTEWVSKYAMRRYGGYNDEVNSGWLILKDTAYNYRPEDLRREGANGDELATLVYGEHISKNILTRLPSLRLNEVMWYNRSKIYDVFEKFVDASNDLNMSSSLLFQHDLIDVTRQTVQLAVGCLYFKIINAYVLDDLETLEYQSDLFLKLLDDLDEVLKSGRKFLLGKWLADAKRCAKNEDEAIHYEFDARNQITLWGPNGEIRDYAAKQWSGLIADYYKPRWNIFLSALVKSLKENTPFNSTDVKERMFTKVEKPFGKDRKIYPREPQGDPIDVVSNFRVKWGSLLYHIFKNSTWDPFEVKSL